MNMRTAPSTEPEFAADDFSEYLVIIRDWHELFKDVAAGAPGAVNDSLDWIGKLVKLVLDPYAQTLGLVDEQREPLWLTDGRPDFTKVMNPAAANASKLTPQQREVAYGLSCIWSVISSVSVTSRAQS
jgi:hypothetical protein